MDANGLRVYESIDFFGAGESERLRMLRLAALRGREKFI